MRRGRPDQRATADYARSLAALHVQRLISYARDPVVPTTVRRILSAERALRTASLSQSPLKPSLPVGIGGLVFVGAILSRSALLVPNRATVVPEPAVFILADHFGMLFVGDFLIVVV